MIRDLRNRRRTSDESTFHGWRYAAIGATMNFLAAGLYGRGFSVYFLPLARDLNLSHTSTSLIFGFSTLEGGLQAPITGYLIDKYGPRVMMIIGTVLAGIGFILLPLADNFLGFVLIYVGVIAMGINAGFHNAAGAIVTRWFVRRRGLAFGVISVGIALGGGILTPIVAALVLNFGWRTAVMVSGLTILLVGLPLSALVRNSPEEVGQAPDGTAAPTTRRTSGTTVSSDFTPRQAFRTVSYWLLATGIALRISVQAGVIVHIVPLIVWKGLDESAGAIVIATISFSAVGTRLFMGWLGDKTSKRALVILGMFAGAAGLTFLLVAPGKLWAIIVFGVIFSVTDGAAGLTWAMIGDYFGRTAYATLRGVVTLVVSMGALATPVIVGRIFDTTEGYFWALVPLTGVYLAAAVVFLALTQPKPRS